MDRSGVGVPPLTAVAPDSVVDLHVHSTASDGTLPPTGVIERASALGLTAVALTDHDTLAGVPEAVAAGERLGTRVVSGCEFSVAAPWGEMHVLGYFIPPGEPEMESFLHSCRADRVRRAEEMVSRVRSQGAPLEFEDVLSEAGTAALGRPHVARALVRRGVVADVGEAFDRFIGRGRPAFVEKRLPTFRDVARLVHSVRGVVSVAHLKDRGTRAVLTQLQSEGLDAVETRHPSHDADTRSRLTNYAMSIGLLRTGGSDWHGDAEADGGHGYLGSQRVPAEWLRRLEQARPVEVQS